MSLLKFSLRIICLNVFNNKYIYNFIIHVFQSSIEKELLKSIIEQINKCLSEKLKSTKIAR